MSLLAWQHIVGQHQAVALLQQAFLHDRVPHAYFFEGLEGVGKTTCARTLFASLNCEHASLVQRPCGVCNACHKVKAGVHPDWQFVALASAGLAEQMDRVVQSVAMSPYEGCVRMVLLRPADLLASPGAHVAANRLLKTLEEPPLHTKFVLLGQNSAMLPTTLRSRLQRIRFRPIADEFIASALIQRFPDLPQAAVLACVAFAQGSLGRALQQAQHPEAMLLRQQQIESFWKLVEKPTIQTIADFLASESMSQREEALVFLQAAWVHGASCLQQACKQQAPLRGWVRSLPLLEESMEAIRRFTPPALAVEHMLYQLL